MIIDKIWEFIINSIIDIFGDAPSFQPPGQLQDGAAFFANAVEDMSKMSYWVNFPAIQNAIIIILSAYGVSIFIHFSKEIISILTGGGGATNTGPKK